MPTRILPGEQFLRAAGYGFFMDEGMQAEIYFGRRDGILYTQKQMDISGESAFCFRGPFPGCPAVLNI